MGFTVYKMSCFPSSVIRGNFLKVARQTRLKSHMFSFHRVPMFPDSSVREWVDEFAPPPHPPLSSSSSSHLTTVSSVPESWAQEYSHDQTDKQAHDWSVSNV